MADMDLLSKSSAQFSLRRWLRAWTLELECFGSDSGFSIHWHHDFDLLNLSVPAFSYMENGDSNSTYLIKVV